MKKTSSNGLFRLFSKGQSNESKQDLHSNGESLESASVTAGLRDMGLEVVQCNYIRPTGHKLEPRNEAPAVRHYLGSRRGPFAVSPTCSEFNVEDKFNVLRSPRIIIPKTNSSNRTSKEQIVTTPLSEEMYLSPNRLQASFPLTSPVSSVHETGLPAFASLKLNFIVGRIATDFDSTSMWTSWLTSYSNGEFNVENPPLSPPLSSNFSYLPAVYPQNEDKRCSVSKNYEINWREWIQELAGIRVKETMKKFGAHCGALSFFDEEYEILKAENGYNKFRIPRSNSIAAHALYTTEVLAILDTKEDWRFVNNPIVVGKPHIRFFAATPLVNSDGDIIGTLSIFSKEPRVKFSYDQRRRLVECGVALTADIMTHFEQNQDVLSVQDTKQDDYERTGPEQMMNKSQNSTFENDLNNNKDDEIHEEICNISDPEIRPSADRHIKLASVTKPSGKVLMRPTQGRPVIPSEHTPPSSVESSQGPSFGAVKDIFLPNELRSSLSRPDTQSTSSSIHLYRKITPSPELSQIKSVTQDDDKEQEIFTKETTVNPKVGPQLSGCNVSSLSSCLPATITSGLQDNIIPYHCGDNLYSSPRPFSSSDLTSLNSLPPNSPIQSISDYDLSHHPNLDMTVEDFLSLSDGDIIEQTDDAFPFEFNQQSNHLFNKYGPPDMSFYNDQNTSNQIPQPTAKNFRFSRPRKQAKTRLPENFLKWKFPRSGSMSSSIDLMQLETDHFWNNNTARNSYTSYTSTPLSSPGISRYLPYESHADITSKQHNKQQIYQSSFNEPKDLDHNCSTEIIMAPDNGDIPSVVSSQNSHHSSVVQSLCDSRGPSLGMSCKSMSPCQRQLKGTISQAAIELATYSKQMGYGLMYIAKIFPRIKGALMKTESDITASKPNGMKVRLLTAHGLSDAIHLCPLIHMRVLRSRGPMSWEDFDENNEFKQGILVVISAEGGPLKQRSKGLILGAFRESPPSQGTEFIDSSAEIKALTELAGKLKVTLIRSKSKKWEGSI